MSEVQNHPGSKHADSRLLDVVALVKRGDAMAFEELYRLTYKYAYFHAKSILHDDDEAWDLVQETYIAVYQHIDSLREERYVKSWISGIVFNLGMKRLRKKRDLLVDGENDFLFDALEDENTDGSPEKALDSKETAAIVREVIDRLPALQKAAVIAYYFDEKSVADIAREAMCSENTIKSRLNYARKAMKEGIEHKERQMGVKLHVVTGPMIVFVLRGMFSSMTVSAQKARYTWMAVRKTLGLAGMAAGAGSAGSAGGGAAGSSRSAGGGAAGSSRSAGGSAGSSASAAGPAASTAAAGATGTAGSAGAGAASLLFGAVKVKTAVIILTACLATGGAAGVAIGKGAIAASRQETAGQSNGGSGSPTSQADVLSANTGAPDGTDTHAETTGPAVDLSDGWKILENNSGYGYMENGEYVRHTWKEIEREVYYFDRNGRMADQQTSLGRQTFSFNSDGRLTGIQAADNGAGCTVYYDEDIRYSLDNGRLIRESPENGHLTLYDGPEALTGFTVSDDMALCFSVNKLLLIAAADGSVLNESPVASLDITAPLSLCLSDSGLYLSALNSERTDGNLIKLTNLVVPPDGYATDTRDSFSLENINHSYGYSPEFFKLQAADGEVYFLRSNRYPTAGGVQTSGYRLCRISNHEATVLMDENVDEFFIHSDTLFYMTGGELKKKSLSQIAAATAERNQKALAAYRERLTEYAKIPKDTTDDDPAVPVGFSVVDLNQDGVFEVLVERGQYFATQYCELLYYTDHLEQADLLQSCNLINENNGLILSTIAHYDLNCTVYHFDGTGVREVANIYLSPNILSYENERAAAAEITQGLADLERWEYGTNEISGLILNETTFDLTLTGNGARTSYIPSTFYLFAEEFLSPALNPEEYSAQ
ncbi:RNA polymerase sigma factor [Enterocloster lavalensis]|uniref:RNA polymerase sigma factor n=1 Tax=Enterocloster lavalensis TaxID=460384 RepID=UPI001E03503B|nr:RNA polymerase sigma factor [Enterocloster lavalensis]MBS5602956.1 RNA polymerase sigma factor [Enterocloster asparagiformis]